MTHFGVYHTTNKVVLCQKLFFIKKISNLQKIILLIMLLVIQSLLIIVSYQFFQNNWIFIYHGLFFRGKYSLQLYCFQFQKWNFQWLKSLKEFFKKKNFISITIYEDFLLIFKIVNVNIFPEGINHDSWKSNNFFESGKKQ